MSIPFTHCLKNFRPSKKIGSGSTFCIFPSVASILIGKEDKYEITHKRFEIHANHCTTKFRWQKRTFDQSITRKIGCSLQKFPWLFQSWKTSPMTMGTKAINLKVKPHHPHPIQFQLATRGRHNTSRLLIITADLFLLFLLTSLRLIYLAFRRVRNHKTLTLRDKGCFQQASNSLLGCLGSSAVCNEEMEANRDLRHNRETHNAGWWVSIKPPNNTQERMSPRHCSRWTNPTNLGTYEISFIFFFQIHLFFSLKFGFN